MKTIEQRVTFAIAQVLHIETEAVNRAKTIEELGCDSLDKVEVCMAIEDEFGIEIPDADAAALTTPTQYVDYVTKRVAAHA